MKVWTLLVGLLAFNAVADDSAKQALKAQLSALTTFSAEFTQQVTDAQQQVLDQADGVLMLQQPNKLYWEVKAPNENILIADGETLWHIDPFVEQVTAIEQTQATQSNPIVLLAEPNSSAWSDYVIQQQGQRFEVLSADETSQIAKLVLVFSGPQLAELHLHNRQQQITKMVFNKILQGQPIPAAQFTLEMPEGFSLDDQRRDPTTGL